MRTDGVQQFDYVGRIVTNDFRDLHVRAQKTGNHVLDEPHFPLHARLAAIR